MANFLDLPSELRNQIYEQCLLHQSPIKFPPDEYYPVQGLTPGLLLTNKQIHQESSSFLYSQNRFDLSGATHEEVGSFLETIGRTNAFYIQHIYTDFPDFRTLEPGEITLDEEASDILADFQNSCTNLRTLTMSPDSSTSVLLVLEGLDFPNLAKEALELVNNRLRGVSPSIEEVVIQVYETIGPSGWLKKVMDVDLGWMVTEMEYFEEEVEGWKEERDWDERRAAWWGDDSGDDDDRDYGYDDDDEADNYDYEYDSDFWRRAGD